MDKNDFINLGKLIIQGRKKLGFSQSQLARKVSISPSGLSKIEHGTTNPSVYTVHKLGKVLNINLFKIFD